VSTKAERDNADADLGEMEADEEFTFPPAERKVFTQPVDLSVQTLVEQWRAKSLILPEIQREYVWDNGKASRLIESLLLNIPIPVLYFSETPDAKYEIIDGHQRVHSIARFIGNEFVLSGLAVLREYKGCRFHELPEREQRFLKMRTLRAILISIDSHPTMKFEVFERLNTGSISLNAQELRNSIYRGPFNRLLREMVKHPVFRTLIGSKTPRKRMVDEELLLRFLALRARLNTYRPPLKRLLNDYMDDTRNPSEEELTDIRELVEETCANVETLIGPSAFRVADASGNPLEHNLNRALFDAQMLTCSWLKGAAMKSKRSAVLKELATLYKDLDFLDAIQRATGDRSRTLRRVRGTVEAFQSAGLDIQVPFSLDK
jgi:uncharacterized protein with ParB-like and HNH nuclease domain